MSAARLVTRQIDIAELTSEVAGDDRGAISIFLGTVRNSNEAPSSAWTLP